MHPRCQINTAVESANVTHLANVKQNVKKVSGKVKKKQLVIVKTCSDNACTIGQKKCPMFVAKIRNYFHSHNQLLQ